MSSPIQAANGPDDLLRIADPAIPYDFARIFHGKGWGARRAGKKKLALLKKLDWELSRMLKDGERVVFASWGTEYSLVESYFLGLWAYFLNRRALVATTRRLLVLQIDSKRRLLQLKSQLRYEAIRKVKSGLWGQLRLALGKGRLLLTNMPRRDRRLLAGAIRHFQEKLGPLALQAGRGDRLGLEQLCPHCYAVVPGRPKACPACAGPFKSAPKAGFLSLLLPGLGDWYLGHRGLAVFELLGALALWVFVIGAIASAVASGEVEPVAALLVMALPAFLFGHGVDALVTRHTARKGLYPEKVRA